jgi:nickel/cobalt exporter
VVIRGTVTQAVLLGLSATLSHTAVVWVIAIAGMYFGRNWNAETSEPYLQVASGVIIIGVALWMVLMTWRNTRRHDEHDHDHGHGHSHSHGHDHASHKHESNDFLTDDYQDAHERAHAIDIQRRFAGKEVTTGQIVIFGLTGGLIPCPASITVLLLCLQMKAFTLGAALVLCFSIGLAVTMVSVGAIAALSVKHAASRFSGLGEFARKAPYVSGGLITLVGLYVLYSGLRALP